MNKEPFVLNLPWALQTRLVVLPAAKRCELQESHEDLVPIPDQHLDIMWRYLLMIIKDWELHSVGMAREKKDLA